MKETLLAVREMSREDLDIAVAGMELMVDFYQRTEGTDSQLESAILLRAYYKTLLDLHKQFYGGTDE